MYGGTKYVSFPHEVSIRTNIGLDYTSSPPAKVLYGRHSCSLMGCSGCGTNLEAVGVVVLQIVVQMLAVIGSRCLLLVGRCFLRIACSTRASWGFWCDGSDRAVRDG